MVTEATHMAYPACEAVMVAHMGTEATHMACFRGHTLVH